MLKLIAFAATAALVLPITPAHADLATVHAGRASARVAANAAPSFNCLIGKLLAAGYRIDFMGGYRPGHCATGSKHSCATAIDINQTARNRVTRRLPGNERAMARACGLFSGSEWHHADAGHFEVPSAYQHRKR